MANEQNLKPWQPGISGNPLGKPKGTKHLSTYIQELMEDENFKTEYIDGYTLKSYEGAPIKALLSVAITKSLAGDRGWADWLAKYGYGTKVNMANVEGEYVVPILSGAAKDRALFLHHVSVNKEKYELG